MAVGPGRDDYGNITGQFLWPESCASLLTMKASKLLLIVVLMALAAYAFSVWVGFDERIADYAASHEQEFRAAAMRGSAEAQYKLGLMYSRGIGAETDDAEALKWYSLAAAQGHAKAQYNLGMMYYFGKGVPRNRVTAYQWVLISAATGEPVAREAMEALADKLSSEEVAQAQQAARAWEKAHPKTMTPESG